MADTQYTINGVPMARASMNSMGWAIMREGTAQLTGITKSLSKITVPGYDGYFPSPSTRTDQVMVFNIRTPRANLEALLAVLSHVGYDTDFPNLGQITLSTASGKAAYFDLQSAIPAPSGNPNDAFVKVTATLNIPSGSWRDIDTTTTTTSIPSSPTTITAIGSGISLPISDMDIFIEGNVGTMQLTDSAGSWLRTTSDYVFDSGYGLFFQASTGRAYRATVGSPWVPTADLGFAVDTSGGGFKITPKFNPTTPNTRSGEVVVLSTLVASVSVKVRWRGAYAVK